MKHALTHSATTGGSMSEPFNTHKIYYLIVDLYLKKIYTKIIFTRFRVAQMSWLWLGPKDPKNIVDSRQISPKIGLMLRILDLISLAESSKVWVKGATAWMANFEVQQPRLPFNQWPVEG